MLLDNGAIMSFIYIATGVEEEIEYILFSSLCLWFGQIHHFRSCHVIYIVTIPIEIKWTDSNMCKIIFGLSGTLLD